MPDAGSAGNLERVRGGGRDSTINLQRGQERGPRVGRERTVKLGYLDERED